MAITKIRVDGGRKMDVVPHNDTGNKRVGTYLPDIAAEILMRDAHYFIKISSLLSAFARFPTAQRHILKEIATHMGIPSKDVVVEKYSERRRTYTIPHLTIHEEDL